MNESAQGTTRVLLVDDHPVVRQGLARLLADLPGVEVCGEAEDAAGILAQLAEKQPDLVILDLSLKDTRGIDVIRQIRALYKKVKLLVCSMHDENIYAERALQAGALGYITKGAPPARIFQAIRRVMEGKVYLSPELSERLLARMTGSNAGGIRTSLDLLSDRELEVFELLGQGRTTRQIAETLYLSVKTIETYRENLKIKLGLNNSAELIRAAVLWLESR